MSKFTLKESDRIIRDVIDDFFEQHNQAFDQKELLKVSLLGQNQDTVEGEVVEPEQESVGY
jgi:hypothetical protein